MIDVKCHPTVAKNVVKSVIVFPNQLGKKNIFLLRFRDLSMQPLIIGRSGDAQLLAPCCLLAARLQPGKDNLVGLDPNLALLAAGFLLYALFNAVFLPSFYKNGYKVGVAFVKATIPMALLMLVMEALPHIPGLTWLDDMDAATQLRLLPVLVVSAVVYGVGMLLTFRKAAALYEKVDL